MENADDTSGMEEEYVEPQLTPEESAAAVAKIKAHGDSMTRVIRGPDAGVGEPYVDTPEKQYASCLIQARSIEEPTRSMILQHCERMRARAPEATP